MSLHKEKTFETEICEHLAAHQWVYDEGDTPQGYDRALALYPKDLRIWVQEAQPQAWEALVKQHGGQALPVLLERLRAQLDQRGTLEVLRHGIDVLGLKAPLRLAQFKPAFGMNPEITDRYQKNRLRVARQVRYSLHYENSIDLVLFLNGIPVATVELKTDYTQGVQDAIDQYRFDRVPNPKGKPREPLLSFPNGALVHFAVSNSEVYMTTQLAGSDTRFLPFNQGNEGGEGNPPNPDGTPTAYLWQRIWEAEGWLEILGRYLIPIKNTKGQLTGVIFPRYHQLDVTRKLQAAVLGDPSGTRYLVQHSAGSGKTNSIAWTAHFLSELHDASDKKVFDTVLVISDRTVIDTQLQDALASFSRTQGVVATITDKAGSKSKQLAEALSGNKKIVVCTLQTFPFALEVVGEMATKGKRFAVVADEAHSSQAGAAAAKLKELLSADELNDLNDGGEVSAEDLLAAQMKVRAETDSITFVAFTATPKAKTIELFGTRPDPTRAAGKDNVPRAFHVYSMRQAIEEGFILDVLKNYTPYSLAYRLAHDGKEVDEREVERSAALKKIAGWVKLHPYNVAQKVQVVVEHFRAHVAPLLGGQAKAMVVVSSRLEAVRWKLVIDKYIASKGYPMKTLAAFSGEVQDAESGPEPFAEESKTLNPGLKGRDIREAFKEPEYRILLVANKFQTGFDQPLLCGMYVDKRLAGIQAVQTLSRLNRSHPGKDTTYVVDFVDQADEVLAAFRTYYDRAELSGTTDLNLVLDLRQKLDERGLYDEHEIDRVVAVHLDPKAKQSDLDKAILPVADRIVKRYKAARKDLLATTASGDSAAATDAKDRLDVLMLFKRDAGGYQRAYTFLSQVFNFETTELEKRAIFFRYLVPLLEFEREREEIDLTKVKLTHHKLKTDGAQNLALGKGKATPLKPMETGGGEVQEKVRAQLAALIEKVNDLFKGDLTDHDKLVYVNHVILGKLLESQLLAEQAQSNSKEQFATSPDIDSAINDAIIDALDAHTVMSRQALNDPEVRAGLKDIVLNFAGLWEKLRSSAPSNESTMP